MPSPTLFATTIHSPCISTILITIKIANHVPILSLDLSTSWNLSLLLTIIPNADI